MKNQKMPKMRIVTKINEYTKQSVVKAIAIKVSIVEKITSYIIMNGRSSLNIMPF